jgi:hypothetical protein
MWGEFQVVNALSLMVSVALSVLQYAMQAEHFESSTSRPQEEDRIVLVYVLPFTLTAAVLSTSFTLL